MRRRTPKKGVCNTSVQGSKSMRLMPFPLLQSWFKHVSLKTGFLYHSVNYDFEESTTSFLPRVLSNCILWVMQNLQEFLQTSSPILSLFGNLIYEDYEHKFKVEDLHAEFLQLMSLGTSRSVWQPLASSISAERARRGMVECRWRCVFFATNDTWCSVRREWNAMEVHLAATRYDI